MCVHQGKPSCPACVISPLDYSCIIVYNHTKDPVEVENGDVVTYTIRIYNEGLIDGYATEVTDYLPEGLRFISDSQINIDNGWTNPTGDGKTIVSTKLADQIIAAFNGTTLSYRDLQVECEVIAKVGDDNDSLKNIAEITKHSDSKGDESVVDRDSTPDNVNTDNHGETSQEDDDDFEQLVILEQYFDLSLRKFITAVNDKELVDEEGNYLREPIVDTSNLNKQDENGNIITTAIYNHTKEPVLVQPNNIVVYMLRVYNEGELDGYASEIKDHLPPYLEFVEGEFNEQYGWEISEDGRTVTSRYLEDELIEKAQTDENGNITLSYVEVPIMCKVVENPPTSENITNIADITEYLDENKEPVTDRDSQEDNVELPSDEDLPGYKDDETGTYVPGQQDDDDFEKVIVKTFDLALRKWVTQAIVIENGKQTITETGHQPYDDPEQVVKVELHRKKINEVTVKFRYSIRVINEGEIEGYAKEITDYIPEGLKFVAEDNPGWTDEGNNVVSTRLLENTLLQPGEYADVEIVLTWINNSENMGLKVNTAEISEDYNDYDIPDKDSTPDNKQPGEDDIDDAPVMLSIETGSAKIYISLGLIILITIAGGTFLIKKYVI